MGAIQAALFAIAAVGVRGAPVDDSTSWQNQTTSTTTTTTSSDEGRVTIFAPVTMESQLSLLLPEFSTTPPAPSPMTEITQLSLEVGGSSGASWTTRHGSSGLRPIVQPSEISLDLPVTDDTGSTRTTVITIAPTAHLERSGTTLLVPIETTTRPPQPKVPHVENPDSSLDNPDPATTEPPATSDDSPPPGVTSTAHTENTGVELVLPTEQPQGSSPSSEDEDTQPSNPPQTPPPTHSGQPPAPSAIKLGTTSLLAGGTPVTLDGTTLSLAPSGALLLNGATVSYDAVAGQPEPAIDTQALASLATAQASDLTGGATSAGTVTETTSARGSASTTRESASTGSSAAPAEQTDSGAGARGVAWPVTGLLGVLGLAAGVL